MADFPATPQRKSGNSTIQPIPAAIFYGQKSRENAGGSANSTVTNKEHADPTPHKPSSHGTESASDARISDVKKRLREELQEFATVQDLEARLVALLNSRGGCSDPLPLIDQFLMVTNTYDSDMRRWEVPEAPQHEDRLYEPFKRIFSSVQSHPPFIERGYIHGTYRDAHSTAIPHDLNNPKLTVLSTYPDSLVANTKRCHKTCDLSKLRYCHVRVAFDIKTMRNIAVLRDRLQIASYAREILAEQPGRAWTPSMLLTEDDFIFYGFDRSGAWNSNKYNIHTNPRVFVLAILTLFANDQTIGHVVPLVSSKAEPGKTVRLHDNLTLLAGIGEETKEIPNAVCHTDLQALLSRHTIRGRGTCCFRVTGRVRVRLERRLSEEPITVPRDLLLKSYWRTVVRPAEFNFLRKARGLSGVGQLVGFAEGEKITAFRGNDPVTWRSPAMVNRIHCQLLLECYDGPLCRAPNPVTFMQALRDAVAGHRALLVDCGILHRDISINNIVYDVRGGRGSQGRIIDLDLAENIEKLWSLDHKSTKGDARTGTIAYMSYKLLVGKTALLGPHDHMDDLESFFYVLCHFIATLRKSSEDPLPLPRGLRGWEGDDWLTCADAKDLFIRDVQHRLAIDTWFAPYAVPLEALLGTMGAFFLTRISQVKHATVFRRPEPYPHLDLSVHDRKAKAVDDYNVFLGALDVALDAFRSMQLHGEDIPETDTPIEVEYGDVKYTEDVERAVKSSLPLDTQVDEVVMDSDHAEALSKEGDDDHVSDKEDEDDHVSDKEDEDEVLLIKSAGSLHLDAALSTSSRLKRSSEGDQEDNQDDVFLEDRPTKKPRSEPEDA